MPPRERPRQPIPHDLRLTPDVLAEMRAALPDVGDEVVRAIIAEVPTYADALTGPMGETIRKAVQLALGGFISVATRSRGDSVRTPAAPAIEGAYQLGRGEARSGRSMDALLAAYRIGARVSWREMSASAVRADLDGETLAAFAELVFTYIDALSASSAAGHSDELATTGRVRERLLDRLATAIAAGDEQLVHALAEQVDWPLPTTLTAVVCPTSRARGLLMSLPDRSLVAPDALDDAHALVLVPDAHGPGRKALLRALHDTGSVAGPPRPWRETRRSVDRVTRALELPGRDVDTETQLADLVRAADPEALTDLRAQVVAPLAELRPSQVEKLVETLYSWLVHQGRREDVAAALFVHPQTVRYRMGQLRDLYGDRLTDPDFVRDAVIALG
ncbi:MAG TPA: helix-turn-helix domain-containing protein [Marmoricola sp.]|nr:helix-turn-helix domain-containing protein [Marmoricola sp.]